MAKNQAFPLSIPRAKDKKVAALMTEDEQAAYNEALRRIDECWRKGNDGTLLNLSNLGLTSLPPEIGQLTALTKLHLNNNQLNTLPPEIGQLAALTELYLHSNPSLQIPESVLGPDWIDVALNSLSPASPQTILDYYFSQQA